MTAYEIELTDLTKSFGAVDAVKNLSFNVRSGAITGFLGPNGAGKTTTLRMLLGLIEPDSGTALIRGKRYVELDRPASVVGAALEASSFHPGRTARDHLRVLAPQVGATDKRCDEVLDLVGLTEASRRRTGGFSLGMRQRMGLATTLLGDPQVLVLDEPSNGLDPEGIVWLRHFLRYLASEGRTILVSSHVLAEVQATVDDVIIIATGRLVHESSLDELVTMASRKVRAASPDVEGLQRIVHQHGWRATPDNGGLLIAGPSSAEVGAAAFAARIELHELSNQGVELEEVFLRLTGQDADSTEVAA